MSDQAMTRKEHYTDGRRWSHISKAWILEVSWNDKEEIAALREELAQVKQERARRRTQPDMALGLVLVLMLWCMLLAAIVALLGRC